MAAGLLPSNWKDFRIEEGSASQGHCDCCGGRTQALTGFIHLGEAALAAYFVRWAEGRRDHGASWDFVVGEWGVEALAARRCVVALDMRIGEAGPSFMVIDAGRMDDPIIASSALKREEVVGTPLAAHVFALVDSVWMGDSRLDELRDW